MLTKYKDNDLGDRTLATKRMELLRALHCEQPRSILEVGSNAGHSSSLYLINLPNTQVHSVDMCFHPYTPVNLKMIRGQFKGRYTFQCGSSHKTLPKMKGSRQPPVYDWITVDGDHSFDGAYHDILDVCYFSHNTTILMMDDCELHCQGRMNTDGKGGCAVPTKSFLQAAKDGLLVPHNDSKAVLDTNHLNCFASFLPKCQRQAE